jgi:hypothetical protein
MKSITMMPPRSRHLTHNLLSRFQVGSSYRVLEPIRLAHKLAGVDVDRHKGLGLIDDNVAA